jgi:hypothetical protein
MAEGDDIYQSWARDEEESKRRRAQRPAPSFTPDIETRMSQGKRQGSYESGNPDQDRFLRTGMAGQPPDAQEGYYRDPAQFKELMQDMYEAGSYGDPQAVEMIQNKYRGSPLQPLLFKAYEEGRRSRPPRPPIGPARTAERF